MGKVHATEEQIAYAKILDLGMKIGLIAIIITFMIYLSGVLQPHVPVSELPKTWGLPVKQYLKINGIHTGWTWLGMLGKGDFLNFVGIAFLAGVTILCYVMVIPILFRKRDTVYGILAVVEVLVLILAASGVLKGGGH